ncbi:MAG: HAD family phosphatase [Acidimicrobiia bacterium]|nr:HAD family phosphatase [Acidimicrobiia bacterium]
MTSGPTARGLPDTVLFDLDGTLVDREPLATAALEEVMVALGDPLAPGRAASWIGRGWPDVHLDLDVTARHGLTFERWHGVIRSTADRLVDEGFPTRLLDGGPELIERLVSQGVAVGIVTGSTHGELAHAVGELGVERHLRVRVAAEDYRVGKPSPEPYLTAIRQLADEGRPPQRWLVVEDSAAGVRSGLAAGAGVLATSAANPPRGHPGHQDLGDAHVVVSSLVEVVDETLLRCVTAGGGSAGQRSEKDGDR